MKCTKCGTEFNEGLFCPECGEKYEEKKIEVKSQVVQTDQAQTAQVSQSQINGRKEKYKIIEDVPWYLSIPFIIFISCITFGVYFVPGIVLVVMRLVKCRTKRVSSIVFLLVLIILFIIMILPTDTKEIENNSSNSTTSNSNTTSSKVYGEDVKDMTTRSYLIKPGSIDSLEFYYKKSEKYAALYKEAIANMSEGIPIAIDYKNKVYKRTIDRTTLYYFGKMKDNKPTGNGVIVNDKGYPIYCGEFKKGLPDGFCLAFSSINGKHIELDYEGEFKKGEPSGKGVVYNFCYIDGVDFSGNETIENVANQFYNCGISYVGDCEKKPNWHIEPTKGKGAKYSYSNHSPLVGDTITIQLLYKGSYNKDGEYDGKGILYFDSGELMYEGEFKKGLFDGKGSLYDENGDLRFKGKFKKGKAVL